MKNKGAEYYTVHGFMKTELALTGAELQVFALIYSYSRGTGEFYGTREYVAKTTGVSVSTVARMLKSLVARGYIMKREGKNRFTPAVYRVSEEILETHTVCRGDTLRESVGDTQSVTESHNNKNNKKQTINTSSSSLKEEEESDYDDEEEEEYEREKKREFYDVRTWGYEGIVEMTVKQYGHLASLVRPETLSLYISKLEGQMLLENKVPHSHYRAILSWIREDFKTEEEAERT